jgi:hypothetical protein
VTGPRIGSAWPGSRTLTTTNQTPELDLGKYIGQQVETWRFALVDGVTGEELGDIHPIRGAAIQHDTARTVKRTLDLSLGAADTAAINTLTDRVRPFMVFPGLGEFPMGRFMFAADPRQVTTGGNTMAGRLTDEMLLIDQQIRVGISGFGLNVATVILNVVGGLPVVLEAEPSPFISSDAWGIGVTRGQILDALSVSGDYWSPWFDNQGRLRFLRTFNPADQIASLDLDTGYRVIRNSIVDTNDLLTAPNVFVVVSNSSNTEVVGIASVPVNAPNSFFNRGFEILQVRNLQLTDSLQAQAVANGLAQRQQIFETVTLSTPPDPRYDSYDVVHWRGENWLSLSWTMQCVPGGEMVHVMRKSYAG